MEELGRSCDRLWRWIGRSAGGKSFPPCEAPLLPQPLVGRETLIEPPREQGGRSEDLQETPVELSRSLHLES